MTRRGWGLALVAATLMGLVALAANVTTTSQMEGDSNPLLAVRTTVSTLMSTGTIWAGLAVLSGWLVHRPVQAFFAGVTVLLLALVVHYGVGLILDMFDPTVWTENQYWFQAAVVLGGPLGLAGAIARRTDVWGLVARLVVPAGAMLEPFVLGMFSSPAILPWPSRVASTVSAVVLLALGTGAGIRVVVAAMRQQTPTRQR